MGLSEDRSWGQIAVGEVMMTDLGDDGRGNER